MCFADDEKSNDCVQIEKHSQDSIGNVKDVAPWHQSKERKHLTLRERKYGTVFYWEGGGEGKGQQPRQRNYSFASPIVKARFLFLSSAV